MSGTRPKPAAALTSATSAGADGPNARDRRPTMNARPRPASPAVDRAGVASVTPRTRSRILGAMMLGIFLTILDQTIVATALPRIVGDLNGGDIYTWVTTVYLLTSTISIPF